MIKNITVAIKEPANSKIIAISFISKKRNRHIARKQKMIFIILAVIIIAGIAVISTIGFNLELKMQETKKGLISETL